ncbi:MAG: nicotinate phosphoribosyltransferase [Gemmatimonadota bacterium]
MPAPNPSASALLTDLYELTMLQAYASAGMDDVAVFEFFVRKLPAQRNFLMAAGLAQVVDHLQGLRFTPEDIAWLKTTGLFRDDFLASLEALRFSGDVHAVPEGTIVFENEPLLRISARMPEAQLVESRVMNLLHYETTVATKAARCVIAAAGRPLIDFGLRRAHGAEAGLLSARASYLAGFAGSATALAGRCYGIPVFGTMAHSFVQASEDEADAFLQFARAQPSNATLLIDTYDTEEAARKVVRIAAQLAREGISVRGVRIDSGDLAEHARRVRRILDEGGLKHAQIFASGNLDEFRLSEIVAQDAPIDAFGVGTRMNTSADAPFLDCAYKLAEYAGEGRRKRSEGKATWPGRKQVFRSCDAQGRFERDVLTLETDPQGGTPLLLPVMRAGRLVAPLPTLAESRTHARAQLDALPAALRSLLPARARYEAAVAPALRALADEVDRHTRGAST